MDGFYNDRCSGLARSDHRRLNQFRGFDMWQQNYVFYYSFNLYQGIIMDLCTVLIKLNE